MREKYKTLFVISGLTIVMLMVFWQVHKFGFVNYDDGIYVSRNHHILTGFTLENVIWVFTSEHCGNWHPLTGLSHILDCRLFGLNPGMHHLVNLLFHIGNTLLLFSLLKRMTGAFWQSAFVAAVFGLHPLHIESVAWISERKDVLSTMFWLLATAAYFRYAKSPAVGRYAAALSLFALGLMSKPMLTTLPFVFLLLDYWPLNRVGADLTEKNNRQAYLNLILEKIPFFVLSAVSSVVTFAVQKSAGTMGEIQAVPLTSRIANAVISYARYIEKMVWPVKLAVLYPYPEKMPPLWEIFSAAMFLLIITIAIIRLGGKYRYLPVSWFWYLGTLVPVIGLVQVGAQSMADRYTYLPFIGLFIAVAWGANDLLVKWKCRQVIFVCLSSVVILMLTVLSWFQATYWRDSISLFSQTIKVTGGNYIAYNNRGLAYYDNHQLDLAINDYSKCLEINPFHYKAYYNLGNVYYDKGEYDLAVVAYDSAVAINPGYDKVYNNRGNAWHSKGRPDLAVADYTKAVEINPQLVDAYFNKARACVETGRKTEAVEAYKAFIRYAPPQYAPYVEQAQQKISELGR